MKRETTKHKKIQKIEKGRERKTEKRKRREQQKLTLVVTTYLKVCEGLSWRHMASAEREPIIRVGVEKPLNGLGA